MSTTIQIHKRGTVTIPVELREKYGIETGDILNLVDLDGIFVLTPMVPMVAAQAKEIEQLRLEAGLSTDELLTTLREQRELYFAKNQADSKNDEFK